MEFGNCRRIATEIVVLALVSVSSGYSFKGEVPRSLPTRNFMVGLGNQKGSITFMKESGVPWDFRYQYVTVGWQTWGAAFAYAFMKENRDNGYFPVITVYFINGIGGGEGQEMEFAALNDPSKVNSYFKEFREIIDQCAQFGDPVILNLEPDMYGYMCQKARLTFKKNDAAVLTAAISNCGHPDAIASGAPNTFVGFNRVLVWMRDKYAPKALLAPMINHWAGDPKTAAQFMNSIGIQWNLLFSEWSDRDAQFKNNWFKDPDDFDAILDYDDELSNLTNNRIMLWQMPCGNMYINPNNTANRYQDNRSEYIFNHVKHIADHGIIGVLFGSGNNEQTQYGNESDPEGGYIKCWAGEYYSGIKGACTPGSSTLGPVPLPESPVTVKLHNGFQPAMHSSGSQAYDMFGRRVKTDRNCRNHPGNSAVPAGCQILIRKSDNGTIRPEFFIKQ